MRIAIHIIVVVAIAATAFAGTAGAAPSPARADAMAKLAFLSGVWRGPAEGIGRDGTRYALTQTERVGPMLSGDIVVIEGRGYLPDGSVGFNAFAIVSWDERAGKYEMRSYAQGFAGTYELKLTDTGFTWEIPAGSGAVIRYTATIDGATWREVGEYVAGGAEPRRTIELNLTRVGDTGWPAADPVPMR